MIYGEPLTTESPAKPTILEVFDALRIAADVPGEQSRPLYAAEAKKHLLRIYPDFSERDFGFRRFVELLQAGQDAGHFRLEITVAGHPRIWPKQAQLSEKQVARVRLKPELWTAMLSWDMAERYWDRRHARALFLPIDDEGKPLWESDRGAFIPIDSVERDEQIDWMIEFAHDQVEPARATLLEALESKAPGAFKGALGDFSLQRKWTARLQEKVTEHATRWAVRNNLAPNAIVEHRHGPSASSTASSSAASPAPPEFHRAVNEAESDTGRLRNRLHQVIDQMSLAELSALSIPARYLLEP